MNKKKAVSIFAGFLAVAMLLSLVTSAVMILIG